MRDFTTEPISLATLFNPLPINVPTSKPKYHSRTNALTAQCQAISKIATGAMSLAELGFSHPQWDVFMITPSGKPWASRLPPAVPFSLEEQGPQADPQEWLAPSVLYIGQEPRRVSNNRYPEILYDDGTKETCLLLMNGQKDGPYQRRCIRTQLGYHWVLNPDEWWHPFWGHSEEGSYFHGLPCGKFVLNDTNNHLLCAGRFELLEGGPDELGLTINVMELFERLSKDYYLRRIRREERKAWAQGEEVPTVTKTVRTNAIVARYHTLSRILPNGMRQSFSVDPELPAVMIERQANETWYDACSRTHQEVLALVQAQVGALQAAQLAAHDELTNNEQSADTPTYLQLLGQAQSPELVTGAKQGGFWHVLWDMLPQAHDGAYLSGILVSSERFLKTLCAPDYQAPVAHYSMKKTRRLVQAPETGFRALPIWAAGTPTPELSAESFCWQAQGKSAIKDPAGEDEAVITYGQRGLADGAFDLYNQAPATAEHGTFKQGQLDPSFSFELFQDYRARFPAACFTLDVRNGEPEGPFKLYFTIDQLFEKGYHAVLLEASGEIKTEQGFKTQKRLCTYIPGTYVKQEGSYEQGSPKITKRHQLKAYQRPYRYYGWGYHYRY